MFLVAAMFRPKAVLLIDHPLGVPRAIHPVPTGMAACGVLAFGGRPRPFPRAAGCLFCHEKPYFSWFTEENINSIAHGGAKRRQGSKQRLCGVQNKAGLKFNAPPLQRRGAFVSTDVSAGRRRERETARPPISRTEMKNAVSAAFFCVAPPKWAAQTAGIRPPSARDSNLQNRPGCLTTGTET